MSSAQSSTDRQDVSSNARRVVAACALLVTGGLLAAPAQANTCGEIPRVLMLLDRSGSMAEMADGQSKWQAARQAVVALNNEFGGQLALGLMLYPHFPDVNGCATGKVNVVPSTASKTAIATVLNKASPAGNSPIIASLDGAREALAQGGQQRHVVLITDGKETCLKPYAPLTSSQSCSYDGGTNYRKCGGCGWQFCLASGKWSAACEPKPEVFTCPESQTCGSDARCSGSITGNTTLTGAAKDLLAAGIKTHVIGFGDEVDAGALSALATAGGTGSYIQATNLSQLKAAFKAVADSITCCGNGQLDAGETCETSLPAGHKDACPTDCDDGDPCTKDTLAGAACNVSCEHAPISDMVTGDGCCPAGATFATDGDCTSCGNGQLDQGEVCDPQIPAPLPGSCQLACNDDNACTKDQAAGSACNPTCSHAPLPSSGGLQDGCCPPGASSAEDIDCLPPCAPGQTTNCVDTCVGVVCGDGERCEVGQCVPWNEATGCDCRLSGGSTEGLVPGLLLALLPLLLVASRGARRRIVWDQDLSRDDDTPVMRRSAPWPASAPETLFEAETPPAGSPAPGWDTLMDARGGGDALRPQRGPRGGVDALRPQWDEEEWSDASTPTPGATVTRSTSPQWPALLPPATLEQSQPMVEDAATLLDQQPWGAADECAPTVAYQPGESSDGQVPLSSDADRGVIPVPHARPRELRRTARVRRLHPVLLVGVGVLLAAASVGGGVGVWELLQWYRSGAFGAALLLPAEPVQPLPGTPNAPAAREPAPRDAPPATRATESAASAPAEGATRPTPPGPVVKSTAPAPSTTSRRSRRPSPRPRRPEPYVEVLPLPATVKEMDAVPEDRAPGAPEPGSGPQLLTRGPAEQLAELPARRGASRQRRGRSGYLKVMCAEPFEPVIDGQRRGVWPSMHPLSLAAGSHSLQLHYLASGALSDVRSISVEPGKTTILFFAAR